VTPRKGANEPASAKPANVELADGEPADVVWRVVLVGMMGSGKTTVGRLVADRMNVEFADTDDEVESATGLDIPSLFETGGEGAFRAAESKLLVELLSVPGSRVVSAGGGAVLDESNRAAMRREATVVWLRADVGTLTDRLGTGEGRPLLARNPKRSIARIESERARIYESVADVVIDTDDRSADQVADAVVEAVRADLRTSQNSQMRGSKP